MMLWHWFLIICHCLKFYTNTDLFAKGINIQLLRITMYSNHCSIVNAGRQYGVVLTSIASMRRSIDAMCLQGLGF